MYMNVVVNITLFTRLYFFHKNLEKIYSCVCILSWPTRDVFLPTCTANLSYQKTAISPVTREGLRAQFQWICSWLVAPQGQRLGEQQRRTACWTRHCRDTVKIIRDKRAFIKAKHAAPHLAFSSPWKAQDEFWIKWRYRTRSKLETLF